MLTPSSLPTLPDKGARGEAEALSPASVLLLRLQAQHAPSRHRLRGPSFYRAFPAPAAPKGSILLPIRSNLRDRSVPLSGSSSFCAVR